MSQKLNSSALTISDTGLKLIKAYEGYRPVDRELVTGQRVVGYGHRLYTENASRMTKAEAEETLRLDLEPFEDMINTEVHAPISQSQFDALCSFAFNIGPKAFLTSDTLRALNNGRPLDAANGFDIWRKSEIAGKTYVVDALMRRRTAEKALFLRTERVLPAGREDLPPVADTLIAALSTEDALPVFSADDANGIVATAPHEAQDPQFRRREDGPAGVLTLTEIEDAGLESRAELESETPVDAEIINLKLSDAIAAEDLPDADLVDDIADVDLETENRPSPIAEAASDIVARLDALIEDAGEPDEAATEDWPESLITTETPPAAPALVADEIKSKTDQKTEDVTSYVKTGTKKPVMVIDELTRDDALRVRNEGTRVRNDSAARYIQSTAPALNTAPAKEKTGGAGLWIPILLGFILVGGSGAALLRDAENLFGEWGQVLTLSGVIIGVGLILMGIYAALRMKLRD